MCVGHHYMYMQTNTNNVNKTWALLQTTGGGKDEPNIVFMWKSFHSVDFSLANYNLHEFFQINGWMNKDVLLLNFSGRNFLLSLCLANYNKTELYSAYLVIL